jgi:hypothetical protein
MTIAVMAAATAHASAPSVFDKPLATVHVKTPIKHPEPGQKHELSCFYYRGVRVKQLDLGEIGAAVLAILPLQPGAARVACREPSAPGEIVISDKEWSGYFNGVKGDWVFFDAEDGTNGGLGFAVFDGRTGKKAFEDLAVGGIRAAEPTSSGLRLRYRRAFAGSCSVLTGGSECWSQIVVKLPGVPARPAPDCAAGYLKAKTAMARGRCEAQRDKSPACFDKEMRILDQQRWDDAPSVIGYDVAVELGPAPAVATSAGGALSCWPSD